MTVDGLVETPQHVDLARDPRAARRSYVGDIHCVTTWSKLDTTFTGVSVDTLLEAAGPLPEAAYVMAHSTTGYTTNLPLADLAGGKAWVVWEFDGEPLTVEHGGPVRLLVPHLYFWKSAKWVTRLELMAATGPGSGSRTATTTAATRGSSSATRATRVSTAARRRLDHGDVAEIERDDRLVRVRLDVADRVDHLPGPALRRAAARARRLHGAALLLGRLRPGRPAGRADGRAAARRRGVGPPARRGAWSATCSRCGARSAAGSPGPARAGGRGRRRHGVVPIVAMLRYAARLGVADRLRVVAVGKTLAELPYANELLAAGAFVALTRENLGCRVAPRRTPRRCATSSTAPAAERAYVCGSVGFASYATAAARRGRGAAPARSASSSSGRLPAAEPYASRRLELRAQRASKPRAPTARRLRCERSEPGAAGPDGLRWRQTSAAWGSAAPAPA